VLRVFRGFQAVVGSSALGYVDSRLVLLSSEAKFPAGLLGSALLLAVLKGRDALGVLLAGGPLVGTLLFDALLRVFNGNCLRDLVEAVVVDDTLPES